ncbi:uncharacterized protein LOC115777222 isoform X2 [Archocentrus centrarchus]|uniref:uncharacterized protein LOC115777222 isoform X2 n=1 Tax=Archocentrus centrarchus TaxID=63155 RepID=UPI0011EA13A8|nr:uncharacterized protein LOC115777222 isoform X2 [Archocentrus centrarchus]
MKMKMEKFVEKFVVFVFLAHVSQHASGVEVEVDNGKESVLLPCRFPASLPSDSVIVWRRDDLNPTFVHTFVDGRDQLGSQNQHYNRRTSIHQNPLQTGDLSLTLRNPTFTDSGNYTCAIRRAGRDQDTTAVHLVVKEPPPPVWPKVLIAVGVPVLLLCVLSLFFMYRVKERQKRTAVDQLKAVEVKEGAPSVLLPCKTKCTVAEVGRVEWMLVKYDDIKICVYENGRIKEHHPDYEERTEMKNQQSENQQSQTKMDFTLTLKEPRLDDGGVYTCTLYDKDGKPLKQKVVALWVKESWWESFKAVVLCRRQKKIPSTSSVPLDQHYQNVEEARELKP